MSKKKGSTIITKTDARGRTKAIDVRGPAADKLFRALLKENHMGAAPDTNMEKYGEEKKPVDQQTLDEQSHNVDSLPEPEKSIEQRAEDAAKEKAVKAEKALEPNEGGFTDEELTRMQTAPTSEKEEVTAEVKLPEPDATTADTLAPGIPFHDGIASGQPGEAD